VQTSAFVGSDDDLAAGNSFHFGDRVHRAALRVEKLFGEVEEGFAWRGERDFSAATVKQLNAKFILKALDR
jgi:hypothetical protein